MDMNKHEKGYTMTELIVTLSIIMMMSSLVTLTFSPLQKAQQKEHFLHEFKNDLYLTQQLAISTGNPTTLYIRTTNHTYSINQQTKPLYTRTFDSTISFEKGTLSFTDVMYHYNGNISKSGTLLMTIDGTRYRVVFLLGKGRFYIEKM